MQAESNVECSMNATATMKATYGLDIEYLILNIVRSQKYRNTGSTIF